MINWVIPNRGDPAGREVSNVKTKKEFEQPGKAQEDASKCAEPTKREFVTKLVTAVGAVAAASLLSGGDNAEAAVGAVLPMEYKHIKFAFLKIDGGFRLILKGPDLGNALQKMGLAPPGSNLQNAGITIEFNF